MSDIKQMQHIMSESDIPQHLQESITSAEAYEQSARREYQIAEKAQMLRVPGASLENETVHRYLGVLRDVEHARAGMESADVVALSAKDEGRDLRDAAAFQLFSRSLEILEDGFAGHRLDRSELKHSLDRILRNHGAHVDYDNHAEVLDTVPAEGIWAGRSPSEAPPAIPWPASEPPLRGDWWREADVPGRGKGHEHLARLQEEARRLDIPEASLSEDLAKRVDLARLVQARQLINAASDALLLPAEPGLTPGVQQRLLLVIPVLRLGAAFIEEHLRPGVLSPSEISGELSAVMKSYGLKLG